MPSERRRQALVAGLAGVVLAALVVQLAVAGGSGGDPQATASALSVKKFKRFKKKTNRKIRALQEQLETLQRQPGQQGQQGQQGPPGLTGLEVVFESGPATNSNSGPKFTTATCPAGKVTVGSGYQFIGGKVGASPNASSSVVLDDLIPTPATVVPGRVLVGAHEITGTGFTGNWGVQAIAVCANAPQ